MNFLGNQRRLALATLLAAVTTSSRAFSEATPVKGKLVIGGSSGSAFNIIGRRLQTIFSEHQVGDFHLEYVPGGGGMTAINRLLAEPVNSNALLLTTSGALCVTPFISRAETFNPEHELTPLAILAKTPFVLFTSSKSHFKNFVEFQRYFSTKGQILSYGISPIYGANHIGVFALIRKLGIEGKAIPYSQTSQLLLDVAEQRVAVGIQSAATIKGMADQKLLHPIAIMSGKRLQALPDVPAMTELGLAEHSFDGWIGLFHQRKVSSPSMDKVIHSMRQVLKENMLKINFAEIGYLDAYKDTSIASGFVRSEIVRYRKIIHDMNLS